MPMLLISASIMIYQLVIGGLIVLAGAVGGRKALLVAVIAASVWTLLHVIVPPLMCLQFTTITVTGIIGYVLAKRRSRGPELLAPDEIRTVEAETRDAEE